MAGQSSWLAYQAHNLEISGSSPLPAKEIRKPVPEDLLKYVIELDPEEVESR